MKFRIIFLSIIFVSLGAFPQGVTNYNKVLEIQITNLNSSQREKLDKNKVIILGDYIFVGTNEINGIRVSNVIISEDLVPDASKRFLISHLIRNILIDGAVIRGYGENESDFRMCPEVTVSESFIKSNRGDICKVLFYLQNKNYFNYYDNSNGSGEKLFSTHILKSIEKDIENLRKKMVSENLITPY